MPVDDRSAQLEIPMDSVLRPRDIQARIRSGESPETVAAAAQTSVEKIMGFATPVLAERAYVAEQALKSSVRRRAGDGPIGHLAEAVAARLRSRDIDPDSVEWDSWRRDDGRWTLAADYLSGESARHAEFVYDTGGRYVVADDDESRWLVGERGGSHGPQPRASNPGAPASRRPPAPLDEQLPLGEDAIELVTGTALHRAGGTVEEEPTVDLTGTASDVRALEPRSARQTPSRGAADWIATQATERPPAPAARTRSEPPSPSEPLSRSRPEPPSRSEPESRPEPPSRSVPPSPSESLSRSEPESRSEAESAPQSLPPSESLSRSQPESRSAPQSAPQSELPSPSEPRSESRPEPLPEAESEARAEAESAPEPAPEAQEPAKKSGRSRRASVPSWDEIMFGSDKSS